MYRDRHQTALLILGEFGQIDKLKLSEEFRGNRK